MASAHSFRQRRGPVFFRSGHTRYGALALLLVSTFSLIGCRDFGAPAFSMLGSYFPAWLACAGIGLVVAIGARVLLIFAGIDEVLPWRLFVYTCLALAVAFMSSLLL
ncbi:YtcA family lipoprotein [Serratia sp. JSRIV006]|uniref:YtcA family lipoprotein n=1 Tax=Serratia sp. JSRIV006 TaxID=2831896 RepID=UPI001CBE1F42|nr:YtcA family lipoprotein [Serratia sp. JSRIV006]